MCKQSDSHINLSKSNKLVAHYNPDNSFITEPLVQHSKSIIFIGPEGDLSGYKTYEYTPDDVLDPCGGGTVEIYIYDQNGNIVFSEVYIDGSLIIEEYQPWYGWGGSTYCSNGGMCFVETLDVLGFESDCPMILPYCYSLAEN